MFDVSSLGVIASFAGRDDLICLALRLASGAGLRLLYRGAHWRHARGAQP